MNDTRYLSFYEKDQYAPLTYEGGGEHEPEREKETKKGYGAGKGNTLIKNEFVSH